VTTGDGGGRAPSLRDGCIARFGTFELDPKTGELRKRGVSVHLQEQPFQVLAMLVERAGDLVTRDELRQRLWSDSVFVDFDQALNKAVLKIRLALGDSAESPRFVETLERRGYRFLASVEWIPTGHERASSLPSPEVPSTVARVTMGDKTFALRPGAHVIGRDAASDIWIDSSVVSRHHARIVVQQALVTIEDLGSRNGTFVNGVRLTSIAQLADRDEIRLGTVLLSIRIAAGKTGTVADAGC
jgi:DNA-binding winged helix-turn-helix (wHTH) protein